MKCFRRDGWKKNPLFDVSRPLVARCLPPDLTLESKVDVVFRNGDVIAYTHPFGRSAQHWCWARQSEINLLGSDIQYYRISK